MGAAHIYSPTTIAMFVYQPDTDIIFPDRVIPALERLRGEAWAGLVRQATAGEDGGPERLAFSLMMIRMNNCITCHADSYRAMRGCTNCSTQTIARFKGGDEALFDRYEQAKRDVSRYILNSKPA